MAQDPLLLPRNFALPAGGKRFAWGRLIGASASLAIAELAAASDAPLLVLAENPRQADQLEAELKYFVGDQLDVAHFVEWETLPWDGFSPHQDIISERLNTLYRLPTTSSGILIVPIPTLMHRLAPTEYVAGSSLVLETGQSLDAESFRRNLERNGYLNVETVYEHGEFALRGSLLDVFPMGSNQPYRIDLLDDETLALIKQDLLEKLDWKGPVFDVSAATGEGTEALGQAIMQELEIRRDADEPEA